MYIICYKKSGYSELTFNSLLTATTQLLKIDQGGLCNVSITFFIDSTHFQSSCIFSPYHHRDPHY